MTSDHRTAPSNRSRQATAREFLAVAFRRKWLIIGLVVVTTITVVTAVLTTPTTWRSIGKVAVRRGEPESLLQTSRRLSGWEEELATEIQVIRSQPVAERAQALLDERARTGGPKVGLAPGGLDAEVVGASNAVLIAYADRDPKVAEAACDAVITAYVAYRQETLNLAYPKAFFDGELGTVMHDLERLELQRRNFTTANDAVAIDDRQRATVSAVSDLQRRRNEVLSDLEEARMSLRQMQAIAADPSSDVPTFGGAAGEQVLIDLRMKVVTQETKLAQLRERLREDAPDVQNAAMTLETLRALLRRETEARVKVAQSRVEALEARLKPIDTELARLQADLQVMPGKQMSLAEMDREIVVLKERYSELVKSSDQARIVQQTTSTVNVLVLEPAGRAAPMNQRDYVRLALAPAFSLVVGIGLAFFVDGLDTRVRTAADAETVLDLPVLATLRERRRRKQLIAPSEETASR
jgi:uncharacterized protein involved in exopolysaccharide biosynthesis